MRPLAFPKTSHLLKRADFVRVYDHGTRYSSRLLSAFLYRNDDPLRPQRARIGFTVPKALGKANVRNLIRRRTREALRLDYSALPAYLDLVVHPRRLAAEAQFDELRQEVRRLIERCKRS